MPALRHFFSYSDGGSSSSGSTQTTGSSLFNFADSSSRNYANETWNVSNDGSFNFTDDSSTSQTGHSSYSSEDSASTSTTSQQDTWHSTYDSNWSSGAIIGVHSSTGYTWADTGDGTSGNGQYDNTSTVAGTGTGATRLETNGGGQGGGSTSGAPSQVGEHVGTWSEWWWGWISSVSPSDAVETVYAYRNAHDAGKLNRREQTRDTSGDRLESYLDSRLKNQRGIGGNHILQGMGDVRTVARNSYQANVGILASGGLVGLKGLLSDTTRLLAERSIRNTGKTVLGPYNPEAVRYITKAQAKNASYFDLGRHWDDLTDAQRQAANFHFLDKIAEAGDEVYLSVPKQKIVRGTWLAKEIEYLTKPISEGGLGYRWLNQWSLIPGN